MVLTLTVTTDRVDWSEGQEDAALASDATVTSSGTDLTSFQAQFTSGYVAGEDELVATLTQDPVSVNAAVTTDTYVSTAAPDTSYVTANRVEVGQTNQRFGLLYFDLSALVDASIVSATLQLTVYSTTGAGMATQVHRVTSEWNGTVTYNTRPTFDPTVLDTKNTTQFGTHAFNVTDAATHWLSNPGSNFGLWLAPTSAGTGGTTFTSSEQGGPDVPRLELTYLPRSSQWDSNLGRVRCAGGAALAAYQTYIRTLSYRNLASDGQATPSFKTLVFTATSSEDQVTVTRQVLVLGAPVVTGDGEEAPPLQWDGTSDRTLACTPAAALTLTGAALLSGAQVEFLSESQQPGDVLAVTVPEEVVGQVSATWSAETGRLSVAGWATREVYQDLLRSLTLTNLDADQSSQARYLSVSVEAPGYLAESFRLPTIQRTLPAPPATTSVTDDVAVDTDASASATDTTLSTEVGEEAAETSGLSDTARLWLGLGLSALLVACVLSVVWYTRHRRRTAATLSKKAVE